MSAVDTEVQSVEPLKGAARLMLLLPLVVLMHGRSTSLDLVVSALTLLVMVQLWGRPEFAALAAFFAVYSPVLFLMDGGPSMVNVFVLFYLFRLVSKATVVQSGAGRVGVFVLSLYAALVLADYVGSGEVAFLVAGAIALWGVLSDIARDSGAARQLFLRMMVYSCLSAMAYGMINDRRLEINSVDGAFTRQIGVQDDPNFMALLLCIALAFVWSIDAHNNLMKLVLAGGLLGGVALTGSLTGIGCAVTAIALTAALKASRGGAVSGSLLTVFAVVGLGGVLLFLASSGFLPEALAARFSEASVQLSGRDVVDFTSGRSDVQSAYLSFWDEQSMAAQLFGGFAISGLVLAGPAFDAVGVATHNSFIDILMVTGLVGIGVLVVSLLKSAGISLRRYRVEAEGAARAFFVAKIVWVMFGMSVSVFPSWTHLLLLFLV